MAASSIAGIGSSALSALSPASNAPTQSNSTLTESDFLKLLVTQLQNQDPLNPVDNNQFATQLTQFSSLNEITQLNSNFSQLLSLQQVSQGADLLGKTITYLPKGSSNTATGTVSSVTLNNGQVDLVVGSNTITLDQVRGIASSGVTNQTGQ